MTPVVAHVMGIPVEESVLALLPAGGVALGAVVIVGRTRMGGLVRWLRRR
jgi:hypothetical protein